MTTPAYPAGLRRPLASKSRSQPASFSLAEPRRGYAYARATGTDVPVFWDLEWRLTAAEAARFRLWFEITLQRGLLEFSLPLATEFGDVEHVCRFMPDSLLPHSSEGGAHSYRAQIMARKLITPQSYVDAWPVLEALPDWNVWAEMLDRAIAALPEAA